MASSIALSPRPDSQPLSTEEVKVILACSMGAAFEWYDFYLYGILAVLIGQHFFSNLDASSQLIFSLLAFASGVVVRPFGAVFFGRLGDTFGRKSTFLATILIMGGSTFLVGVLPGSTDIGLAAPSLLIALRMLQGLALGGEYGGAATYVAEHAPRNQRGKFTSWIQTTATLGLFLAIVVVVRVRMVVGDHDFASWGWRVPFLLSGVLLVISVWIRLKIGESPVFQQMKEEGRLSRQPLRESFGTWRNLRTVLIMLGGVTVGQAVVWYTGHFYVLFFLTGPLHVEAQTANVMLAAALMLASPFYYLFGSLSDRVGRKPVVLGGCLLAALTYFPLFHALTMVVNPQLYAAQRDSRITVIADPSECSFQFNPTGLAKFTSSCDVAKQALALRAASYSNEAGTGRAAIRVGGRLIPSYATVGLTAEEVQRNERDFSQSLNAALEGSGYKSSPQVIGMGGWPWWAAVGILTVMLIYVTMVYGPIAALLVESFPTRIRYTSMSLPYHIGNGWFGGLLPATGVAIVAQTGDMYNGLWYPTVFAASTFVLGLAFVRETRDVDICA